ncbi:MAG: hypothetical protein FJ028_02390 [Chloroflexi bacterium]|nr:hypothetical protein [Chloroflexota bacterium]
MVERPVTAAAFGPKPVESVALRLATAVLEAVILFSALRIWRLGHSVGQAEPAFLDPGSAPLAAAGMSGAASGTAAVGPIPGVVLPQGKKDERERPEERPAAGKADKPLDSPFASGTADASTHGLHLAGAFLGLALALARAASPRATRPRRSALPL